MPTYPMPGKGLSVQGLNKDEGWGSRNPATGQLVDFNHRGDQGIAHTAGLSKSGLDTAGNPVVTSHGVAPIAATAATIIWTTQTGQPAGSVQWRLASGGTVTVTAETPGTTVSHSVPLTGLTAGMWYDYVITQPALTGGGVAVLSGSFLTPLTGLLMAEGQTQVPPAFRDTTNIHDSKDLVGSQPPLSGPPAFQLNNLEVDEMEPTRAVVLWRTSVYADGTVMLRSGEDDPFTVDEPGAKRRNHVVVLDDLEPDTHYEVAVISADAEGNTVDGGPLGFNTPAE